MPQELQVLRCFNCESFQVDIVKKVPKWICKICLEKQTVKKVYFSGSGKECRRIVQDLNRQRIENRDEHLQFLRDNPEILEHEEHSTLHEVSEENQRCKWETFLPATEKIPEEEEIEDAKFCFEKPKKERKRKLCDDNSGKVNLEKTRKINVERNLDLPRMEAGSSRSNKWDLFLGEQQNADEKYVTGELNVEGNERYEEFQEEKEIQNVEKEIQNVEKDTEIQEIKIFGGKRRFQDSQRDCEFASIRGENIEETRSSCEISENISSFKVFSDKNVCKIFETDEDIDEFLEL